MTEQHHVTLFKSTQVTPVGTEYLQHFSLVFWVLPIWPHQQNGGEAILLQSSAGARLCLSATQQNKPKGSTYQLHSNHFDVERNKGKKWTTVRKCNTTLCLTPGTVLQTRPEYASLGVLWAVQRSQNNHTSPSLQIWERHWGLQGWSIRDFWAAVSLQTNMGNKAFSAAAPLRSIGFLEVS